MKTEMTSVDIAALVYELNHAIRDARIENIYQTNDSTLLLRLHIPNQLTQQLLIEAGKRVHLTTYVLEKPFKPPTFCMTLRKYLRNSKIVDVQQHEFERIITLRINTHEGIFQLIIELFGEGNIILVNQQNVIIAALIFKKMRDRNILRHEIFQHAPSSGKNPFHVDYAQVSELRNFDKLEIVRALTKFLSIGGTYAEELLLRAGVDKNTPCQNLIEQQLEGIYGQLKTMLSILTERKFDPAIIIDEKGEWVDVTPIGLKRYEGLGRKPHKTFNEALAEYYSKATHLGKVSVAQKESEKELTKQQRMLQDQQKTISDSKIAIEQNKRIGDLIYAHLGELQLLLQQILDEKQNGKNWEKIVEGLKEEKQAKRVPAVYFDSLDAKHMLLHVSLEDKVFPIKINHSIQVNAAEYYEKMKKAERKLEGSKKALQETQSKIQQLQKHWTEKIDEVQRETAQKQAKKAWYEKFRWFYSSENFLVIGGKDAITNEILIKKHSESHDIVFHADIVGAPFVVVKTQGKSYSEQTIQEAAQFAACYSRAWREMLGAIDVYWVHPNQVSKTPPPGQFLEKGSFIIQGAKNYVRSVPLRVGIGAQMEEDKLMVLGGPARTVSKRTSFYVELVPGRQPSSVLAGKIRGLLVEKVPLSWRERVLAVPKDELQSFVPFGVGEVILK